MKPDLLPGLDHIANFINALDSEGMSSKEVRTAIYAECLAPRTPAPASEDAMDDQDYKTLVEALEANAEDYTGELQCEAAQAIRDLTAENERFKALGDGLAEAAKALDPYIDAIICFASTQGEYEPNSIAAKFRAARAAWESK